MNSDFDVMIIGGGPAGLGAALALGRMRRNTLVIDDERPRNAPADHMNNFPGRDGLDPRLWRQQARQDIDKYKSIRFRQATVSSVRKEGRGFAVRLSTGDDFHARKIILAYGVADRLPPLPGLDRLWGKSIFHCPYCHGYEVRGTATALVGNGKIAEHLLPMIYSLSQNCLLFTNGPADLDGDFLSHMKRKGVRLIEPPLRAFLHEGPQLKGVTVDNGETYERENLFFFPILPFQGKSSLGDELGCEKNEMGFFKVDLRNKTTVEGVFAAGDIMSPNHSVLGAAAMGQMAAAGATSELLAEDFRSEVY